ncbi:MAG: heparan-alpha-glucosaminide N-acetyltransferase domain-containing protein [Promethearchaeota archaeon]
MEANGKKEVKIRMDANIKTDAKAVTEDKGTAGRIRAFDILRGTSILLMIIAHVGNYWLTPDSRWLVGLFFLIVNVQGTNGFTFVAGLGFGYSWFRNKEKFRKKRSLTHTFLLFVISIGFNIISALVRKNPFWFEYFWYWNILQTIAVCRLLGELLLRLKIRIRLVILIVMIPVVYFLTFWIVPDLFFDPIMIDSELMSVLFYLLYNPLHADGILFFLPFFIMGTIAGELLWKNRDEYSSESRISPQGTNISPKGSKILRIGTIIGAIFMITGIGLGLRPLTYDYGWNLLQQINIHTKIQWEGIPLFLIANSAPWTLYSLGFELLFLIFIFKLVDINKTESKSRLSMVEYFGRYSLSIYLGHYIILFLPWFQQRFDELSIWIPLFLFVGVIYLFARVMNHPKYHNLALETQMQKMIRHYTSVKFYGNIEK